MQVQIRRSFACTVVANTILTLSMAALLATPKVAPAQTFTLLHTFAGPADGATPQAPLIMDSKGNLYGTTVNGHHVQVGHGR